jgi:hypothetical protein
MYSRILVFLLVLLVACSLLIDWLTAAVQMTLMLRELDVHLHKGDLSNVLGTYTVQAIGIRVTSRARCIPIPLGHSNIL